MQIGDIPFGASITFSSGFFARILSMSHSGISREAVETTHFGSTAASANQFGVATFIPGDVVNPGELEVEFEFDGDTLPPIASAAETVTVTFPLAATGESTATTWAGSAFMTDFSWDASGVNELITGSATIKFSGPITRTAAS